MEFMIDEKQRDWMKERHVSYNEVIMLEFYFLTSILRLLLAALWLRHVWRIVSSAANLLINVYPSVEVLT